MAKKVNQTELAEIHGVTDVTLWAWQKEGMSIARRGARGEANEYDTAAVVSWIVERAERKARADDPKAALYRTQVRLNELKLGELEGKLVNAAEVEAAYSGHIVSCRTRLLQIPDTLAGQLAATTDARLVHQVLAAAIVEALLALSKHEPAGDPAQ